MTLAGGDYDRTRALQDGTVEVEGCELNYIPLTIEEIFWRQLRYGEFDASELSCSAYVMLRSRGQDDFIAIPVFPSKMFRHSCMFINKENGITRPEDLRGRRVGVPEYHMTAALWQRGIMQHEYGIKPSEIEWITGGGEDPGRVERVELRLPPEIKVTPVLDRTLNDMLVNGEIDALFGPRMPSSFMKGSPVVRRLFPNYAAVEKDYYQRTGIFPIMHIVAIKRKLYEENPWVAQSLVKAFTEAKDQCLTQMYDSNALTHSLPFLMQTVEDHRALFGPDLWSYGIESNRKTLEALALYSYEQGLSERLMTLEELFAPNTFTKFHI
ncbi:MAG: ABC transporter substrate-binding protein [Chloroflexi bacterium]|nr:ABC transporter substrate-binding protein [Chloroflexota bacterium]